MLIHGLGVSKTHCCPSLVRQHILLGARDRQGKLLPLGAESKMKERKRLGFKSVPQRSKDHDHDALPGCTSMTQRPPLGPTSQRFHLPLGTKPSAHASLGSTPQTTLLLPMPNPEEGLHVCCDTGNPTSMTPLFPEYRDDCHPKQAFLPHFLRPLFSAIEPLFPLFYCVLPQFSSLKMFFT